MGLDFKSLSKNPERNSIRSEKIKNKLQSNKERLSMAASLRENAYCEIAY